MKRRIIVVGNGMVGHRFCDQLHTYDANNEFELLVFGEEPRPVYDRVNLSKFFEGLGAEGLAMATADWYSERDIQLRTGTRVAAVDTESKCVTCDNGVTESYDILVLATGSSPFVPPVPGVDKEGVFVYRTIEDLEAIALYAKNVSHAVVIGGGLLGLEAAKAAQSLGLEAAIVEFAPRLMPRQLNDAASDVLAEQIHALGVDLRLNAQTQAIEGNGKVEGLSFANDEPLPTGMVIVAAGIRPRDELARAGGLVVGERGGVVVDDHLHTSAENVFAIGEIALHKGMIYGLVAPGYEMADCLASTLTGTPKTFEGGDLGTKLKLMGVDVASFGDPFGGGREIEIRDASRSVYKKLTFSEDGKTLVGGILVGEVEEFMQLSHFARTMTELPCAPHELLLGGGGAALAGCGDMQVCSCNNVSHDEIVNQIHENELFALVDVKECTLAGTGCGGCMPVVSRILDGELAKLGRSRKKTLCPHFELTRQELFQIVKVKQYKTFSELLENHGQGTGCEICKPVVASILASLWNESLSKPEHTALQDTNDRFFANIQRRGTYSVVPRVPGGEITPEQLIVLGQVARKYDLYTKITGGQRVDLFGARVDQLPDIWAELVAAGFESGHAYGKAVRTVKSCVGTSWCRYGVQDSVSFAITTENRYRGIRAPHKIKMSVSGCIRECAEAQSKDIGIIATEKGWNLYVCGNGGSNPRHADLFATDLDDATALKYIDRVLMYYIHTAEPLTRTARWLESLEGGLDHLREVVIEDSLGICEQLDEDMSRLVDTYTCEWAEVVNDPELQKRFRHFMNTETTDETAAFTTVRGQKQPLAWSSDSISKAPDLDGTEHTWFCAGKIIEFPPDCGVAVKYGSTQIAVYNFASRGEWFATQNMCPHKKDMVLSRGLLGDANGTPKVACPLHKKTYSLVDGNGLNDPNYSILQFEVKVENGEVFAKLPPPEILDEALKTPTESCAAPCSS